jgi:hypothetical protein
MSMMLDIKKGFRRKLQGMTQRLMWVFCFEGIMP